MSWPTGRGEAALLAPTRHSACRRCSFGSLSVTSTEDRESVQLPGLVPVVRHAVALPVIAAGGIATAADVTTVLRAARWPPWSAPCCCTTGERTRPGLRPLLQPWLPPTDAARWARSHTGPGRTGGALRPERPSRLRQSARGCPLRDQRRASIIRNPDTSSL
ncbi:nitronate monooxygenase [Streptacidiphilus carbonis]|uniref:nitronate monooxygenase n=1 Tax=Streptacidiphilus carbonis TaxID=105422 RepID=UPI0034E221C5